MDGWKYRRLYPGQLLWMLAKDGKLLAFMAKGHLGWEGIKFFRIIEGEYQDSFVRFW